MLEKQDQAYLQLVKQFVQEDPPGDPTTYRQATEGGDSEKWEMAIKEEMASLEKMGTCVRIRSHNSNTTRNSGEFPRYVYLFVIRFPETLEFPMFSISGKLRNSDVSDFQKLRTLTFFVISHSFMYFTFHL